MTSARSDERIQPALHALLVGDTDGLRAALEADPDIVNLSVGGNTLLELATQPHAGPPSPAIVEVLVTAGAALDRALNLAGCWNLPDLCSQLLAAGADPAARADAGITPLESAAMHSSNEAADVLVEAGLHRPSLWLAAAAGLLPVVMEWVAVDGSLRADAGPYRPNWADVGRPAGAAPSDDPSEILGEAFVFAALNNRRAVVNYLLESGADIDARPFATQQRCISRSSSSAETWSSYCSIVARRPQSKTTPTTPTPPDGPAPATTTANPQPPFANSWASCREPFARGDRLRRQQRTRNRRSRTLGRLEGNQSRAVIACDDASEPATAVRRITRQCRRTVVHPSPRYDDGVSGVSQRWPPCWPRIVARTSVVRLTSRDGS